MIDSDRFVKDVFAIVGRDIASNMEQLAIVMSPPEKSLKVVAGPGSGKTTVIVLRLLKMVFVDDITPESIMATTFTRKAAKELKSRILKWGHLLQFHYSEDQSIDMAVRDHIRRLNFDLIVTGTLDSIAEDALTIYRQPNENPPMMITEFVSKQIMLSSLFDYFQNKEGIKSELSGIGISPYSIRSTSGLVKMLLDIYYRSVENMIDVHELENELPLSAAPIQKYVDTLKERQFLDFPALESHFIQFLSNPESDAFCDGLRILMVDEYQDTNLQQESIYKILGNKVVSSGGSMIVVGDDDQSIYRFRGSRVHLFADLESRFQGTGVDFAKMFLSKNYRSTPEIVDFCNDFIAIDDTYQDVRVREKPPMTACRECDDHIPVLGIFRDSPQEIANIIVDMVNRYVQEGRYVFRCTDGSEYVFERSDEGGANDFVLLMNSTKYRNTNGGLRLPSFISAGFRESGSGIQEFNPRGNNLYDDPYVMILCGTLLICIDPDRTYEMDIRMTNDVSDVIMRWRGAAEEYIRDAPEMNGCRMADLVESWKTRTPYPKGKKWDKSEVSILDIAFQILTWIPDLRNDAEEMVYLQALCEAISSSILVKNREVNLAFEKGTTEAKKRAVKDIYYKIFIPIADGTMDVDEDLFFSVTMRDRFSIMTVHQSKGLEFPITIVDVSSDLTRDVSKLVRYPDKEDATSIVEGVMRRHSPDIPADRDLLDAQYDDIVRKSFVAYSRAQDVLILIGTNRTLDRKKPLKHMGLGWDRNGDWVWEGLGNIKMMRRSYEDNSEIRTLRHTEVQPHRGPPVLSGLRTPVQIQQQGLDASVRPSPAMVRRVHPRRHGGSFPEMDERDVRHRPHNVRERPADIDLGSGQAGGEGAEAVRQHLPERGHPGQEVQELLRQRVRLRIPPYLGPSPVPAHRVQRGPVGAHTPNARDAAGC